MNIESWCLLWTFHEKHQLFLLRCKVSESKSFVSEKLVVYLQLFSCRGPLSGGLEGWEPIYRKGVTWRFVLDILESGSSQTFVKNKATMTPIRMCYIRHSSIADSLYWSFMQFLSFIYIFGVGFGVARFDKQAMPEPQDVEWATRLPTSFLYIYEPKVYCIMSLWGGGNGNRLWKPNISMCCSF